MEAALLYAMGLFSDPSMQNEGIPSVSVKRHTQMSE